MLQYLVSKWNIPLRRIFIIWGVIMLVGFPFPYYIQWVPLTIIGLILQFWKQPIRTTQAWTLHGIWAVVLILGMIINFVMLPGTFMPDFYPNHWGVWWLALISVPQIITGFMLKDNFQKILGVVWLIAAIGLWNTKMYLEMFYVIALLTGLPYLYIGLKK